MPLYHLQPSVWFTHRDVNILKLQAVIYIECEVTEVLLYREACISGKVTSISTPPQAFDYQLCRVAGLYLYPIVVKK